MNEEAKRRAVCRKIAQDMYAAGMGWHEDALLRFTHPPLKIIFTPELMATANLINRLSRRQKRHIRKRRARKVRNR